MKLQFNESLRVAHEVLELIDVSKQALSATAVHGYENGREHGLCAIIYDGFDVRYICWSQNRNSDQIVVYVGQKGERFHGSNNIPTQRAYDERKFFSTSKEAAEYISNTIKAAV